MTPADPASPPHCLDNVIWSALTSRQESLAIGNDLACRFQPAFARFAALRSPEAASLEALARLVEPDEWIALFLAAHLDAGPYFEAMDRKTLLQMVGPSNHAAVDTGRFVVLGPEHRDQMTALVQRTAPGPWMPRSNELGRFLGVFEKGELVAMAGERMRLTGHTEVSAVCTDPAWRGRGLAVAVTSAVAQAIIDRGERPFLHVVADNASAIALYEKLGFTRRAHLCLHVLRRAHTQVD